MSEKYLTDRYIPYLTRNRRKPWLDEERVMRYLRRLTQLTQFQVSRRTGITQPRISYFENGLEMDEHYAIPILRLFSTVLDTEIVPPEGMTGAEFLQAPASPEMKRYIAALIVSGGGGVVSSGDVSNDEVSSDFVSDAGVSV